MINPYKLYRQSQDIQRTWIRKHPVQWIVINLILTAVFIGYMELKDRKLWREFDENVTTDPQE